MKKILLLSAILLMSLTTICSCNRTVSANEEKIADVCAPAPDNVDAAPAVTKIQVAILLDTSGSMNGLIEQAKSRLWNIVNTLTTLKYQGRSPKIEIALYEYGSSRRYDGDYIRQITPLTTDLDLISQELFALTTGGSEEYCGTVISMATKNLEWGSNEADMKLIYIAGNEVFEQGRISYKTAIPKALEKNIYVNTIHCGDMKTGVRDLWRDAANKGKGKFFNIDHNARVRHIVTPYDDRISSCNARLNDTYISYCSRGYYHKENQMAQDYNAESMSKSIAVERTVSKSKSVYSNKDWDLVDKMIDNSNALAEMEQSELPAQFQGKSNKEIEQAVAEKQKERTAIQNEINELAKKRQAYIDEEMKKDNSGDDLGKAIAESIVEFANLKGFSIDKN